MHAQTSMDAEASFLVSDGGHDVREGDAPHFCAGGDKQLNNRKDVFFYVDASSGPGRVYHCARMRVFVF